VAWIFVKRIEQACGYYALSQQFYKNAFSRAILVFRGEQYISG
jgi:hypothetical protein